MTTKQQTIEHKQKHEWLKLIKETGNHFLQETYNQLPDDIRTRIAKSMQKEFDKIAAIPETGECNCESISPVNMTVENAIEYLSDGHTGWSPAVAIALCEVFNVTFNKKLIQHGYSDWFDYKGNHMAEGKEGACNVYSLELTHYICRQLGIDTNTGKIGRGSDAMELASRIQKWLTVKDAERIVKGG